MSIAAQLETNLRNRVARNLPNVSARMVQDTQAACSRRTGQLAESVGADDWQESGTRYTTTIRAAAPYAAYQEYGTGIHGPMGAPIRPRRAGGVLVFDWPAAGGLVFARSVQGSVGTHFFYGEDGQAMERRFSVALSAEWQS